MIREAEKLGNCVVRLKTAIINFALSNKDDCLLNQFKKIYSIADETQVIKVFAFVKSELNQQTTHYQRLSP